MTDTTIVDPAGQPVKAEPPPAPKPPEPKPPADPAGHVATSPTPPPGGSVGTTAIAALSGAGAGDTIMWIFECFQQGKIVTPETDLATLWGAALMPLGHALYQMLLRRLSPPS